jgi:hypothetical protein
MPRKPQWKTELQPYAILLSGINEDLMNKSEDELQDLLEACTEPTSTNCWWATMHAAKFIEPLVKDEIARRTYAAGKA